MNQELFSTSNTQNMYESFIETVFNSGASMKICKLRLAVTMVTMETGIRASLTVGLNNGEKKHHGSLWDQSHA